MAKKPLKERLQKLAGISKFKSLINEQSNPDIINWVNQLYASNVGTGIAEGCSYAATVQSTAVVSDESYYEECQYSTDTNLIDNAITCLNGGRHVVTKACMPDENGLMPDGGSPSNNIQGQLETGNYINDPILGLIMGRMRTQVIMFYVKTKLIVLHVVLQDVLMKVRHMVVQIQTL